MRNTDRAHRPSSGLLLDSPGYILGDQGPPPVGIEFQINTYTTSSQRGPAVSLDPQGNFVVVWDSLGSNGGDTDRRSVQGQRYNSEGSPLGAQFQVNTYSNLNQDYPSIGTDSFGNFVVVWSSEGSPGDDGLSLSIQGQRYDSDGLAIGDQFQINSYTTGLQDRPDIAVNDDGSFIVAWESSEGSGSDTDGFSIEGQRFDSSETPAGAQFQVNTYTTNTQRYASVASDSDGNFIVVWWSVGSGGNDDSFNSIQGQRYDALGFPVGGEFQVNTYTTGPQTSPVVEVGDSGSSIVAWRSDGSSGTDTDGSSIQAQRFNPTGQAVGAQFQVNSVTTYDQGNPAIGIDADGDFVVVWFSFNAGGGSDIDVQGQLFDSLAAPIGSQFQVNTYATTSQSGGPRAVGFNNNDGFVVVWQSNGSSGTDSSAWSVQGQRFGPPDLTQPPAPNVSVLPNPVMIETLATLRVVASDVGTGDNPITAIEYQIDGGNWIAMSPLDGSWDEPTEQAEEPLVFDEGGSYTICARAFDVANNQSDTGCTDVEALVPEPTLRLRAIEVNQVIQNWRNEIPLYRSKPTVVRVFFEKTDSSSPNFADGLLHGSIGGTPLPGSPLSTAPRTNVGDDASAFMVVDGPDPDSDPDDAVESYRAELGNSLNYSLPGTWINQGGTVNLEFELTSPSNQVLECAEPDGNPDCLVGVQFESIDRPIIEFFSVPYQRNEIRQINVDATGGSYFFVSGNRESDPVAWDAGIDEIEDAIEDALDSRDGRVVVQTGSWCDSSGTGAAYSITLLRGQSESLQVNDSGLTGSATMILCEAGGPLIAPTDDDLREQARRVSDVFPSLGVDFRLRRLGRFKRAPTLLKVNTRLSKVRAADAVFGNQVPKSFALLLERGPTSTKSGMAWLAVSSTYALFREEPEDGGLSRSTGMHEAAHTYGRAHAVVFNRAPLGSIGLCGSKYNQLASPLHPFVEDTGIENPPAADIDEALRFTWPTIGPLSSGPDDEIWGFSPRAFNNGRDFEHLVVVDPRMSAELMSYCDPPGRQQDRWVSSFSYEKLRNRLGSSRETSDPSRGFGSDEFLLVAGSIDEETGEAEIEPITRVTGADPGFEPGELRVAILDEFGFEISSRDVALLVDGDHSSLSDGVGPEPIAFFAALPVPPLFEFDTVAVTLDNTEIGRVTASVNPPTVAITSPTGGSTATDTIPIAWDADDLDGDPLTTTILYSADTGVSWKTLAVDLEGESYDAPTSYLEGSIAALIRLLVSDGFHTTEETSDPFEVDAGYPSASIEVPVNGIAVDSDGLLHLRGDAWDPEDGSLEGLALSWTATGGTGPGAVLPGIQVLGTGQVLDVPAAGLSAGCQLIVLTATDSDGKTDTDSVEVDIGATGCLGLFFADGFESGDLSAWSSSAP